MQSQMPLENLICFTIDETYNPAGLDGFSNSLLGRTQERVRMLFRSSFIEYLDESLIDIVDHGDDLAWRDRVVFHVLGNDLGSQ